MADQVGAQGSAAGFHEPHGSRAPRLPGVEGVWVFVGADAVIFTLLFGVFLQARWAEPERFEASRQLLDVNIGGINTVILLTSSWLVARAVQAIRDGDARQVPLLLGGIATGTAFVVSKGVEYTSKLLDGVTPVTDPFFMWFYVLTGIHLMHVLGGLVALVVVTARARVRRYGPGNPAVPESVATFWHLVDALWIVIFPLLYLLR